jgi:hypothetical protein
LVCPAGADSRDGGAAGDTLLLIFLLIVILYYDFCNALVVCSFLELIACKLNQRMHAFESLLTSNSNLE